LVEQGLELVVVEFVQQQDIEHFIIQRADDLQAGEPAAYDYDFLFHTIFF
jgi:hypothetical protein